MHEPNEILTAPASQRVIEIDQNDGNRLYFEILEILDILDFISV